MIRINENWVVDVDEYNYTLKRDLHHKTTKKKPDGTTAIIDAYKIRGYYSNLQSALNRILDEMLIDNYNNDKEISLKEAIQIMESCVKEWREITKDILEVKE